MFPGKAPKIEEPEERKKIYLDSLLIKIGRSETELNNLQILSKCIDSYLSEQETTVEVHFQLTDIIYVNALSRILEENCFFSEDNPKQLIYKFPYTLDSLADNFFSSSLKAILKTFRETLMPYIVEEAVNEFNLLRGKQLSEKDFRTLKHEVGIVDDPIQYITDIRQIIENAHHAAVCFRNEYNHFYKIGQPVLGRLSEEINEDVEDDEEIIQAIDDRGLIVPGDVGHEAIEITHDITQKLPNIEKKQATNFATPIPLFPAIAKQQESADGKPRRRSRSNSIENPTQNGSTHLPGIK